MFDISDIIVYIVWNNSHKSQISSLVNYISFFKFCWFQSDSNRLQKSHNLLCSHYNMDHMLIFKTTRSTYSSSRTFYWINLFERISEFESEPEVWKTPVLTVKHHTRSLENRAYWDSVISTASPNCRQPLPTSHNLPILGCFKGFKILLSYSECLPKRDKAYVLLDWFEQSYSMVSA